MGLIFVEQRLVPRKDYMGHFLAGEPVAAPSHKPHTPSEHLRLGLLQPCFLPSLNSLASAGLASVLEMCRRWLFVLGLPCGRYFLQLLLCCHSNPVCPDISKCPLWSELVPAPSQELQESHTEKHLSGSQVTCQFMGHLLSCFPECLSCDEKLGKGCMGEK